MQPVKILDITSIYGRDNFFDFIARTNEAGAILSINKKKVIEGVDLATVQFRGGATLDDFQERLLPNSKKMSSYAKEKGSMLWGRQQSPPRHNSEPTNNILTKDDIVKRITNITHKEKKMTLRDIKTWARGNGVPCNGDVVYVTDDDSTEYRGEIYAESYAGNISIRLAADCVIERKLANGDWEKVPLDTDAEDDRGDEYERLEYLITDSVKITSEELFAIKYGLPIPEKIQVEKWDVLTYKLGDEIQSGAILDVFENGDVRTDSDGVINTNQFMSVERGVGKERIYSSDAYRENKSYREYLRDNYDLPIVQDYVWETEKLKQISPARGVNRANNKLQESNMEEKKEFTSEQKKAFLATLEQSKVIKTALANGTLVCLPGSDGYADTTPAVNIATGTHYHGATLLQLKAHQKKNEFPTAEYVTRETMLASGIGKKDQRPPVDITFSVKKDKEWVEEWEDKTFSLFNIAQSVDPDKLKQFLKDRALENAREIKGADYQMPEKKEREPGPEVVCNSTQPEKYLAQYLAAVSMNSKFKATPEQAKEFAENLSAALEQKTEKGIENPFNLKKICNEANKECKNIMYSYASKQEQKLEQTKSLGRSM